MNVIAEHATLGFAERMGRDQRRQSTLLRQPTVQSDIRFLRATDEFRHLMLAMCRQVYRLTSPVFR